MKKEEVTRLVQISILMSAVVGVAYFAIAQSPFDFKVFVRATSTAISITAGFWTLYFWFFWRYRPFSWILYRPDIRGTWGGLLRSNWIGPEGPIPAKNFFIVVHQNFLNVSFTTFTDNFIGVSYSENILFDENRDRQKVVYLYMKDTADTGAQERNEGVAELRIIRDNTKLSLEGKYWTNINTKGSIHVELLSRKHVDSYSHAIKFLPE